MRETLRINKYCTEIDWEDKFEEGFNLVVAGTGSGKTTAAMSFMENHHVGFVAPYVSVVNQVGRNYDVQVKVGTKTQDFVYTEKAMITSYHSIPRMLEMEKMEYLFIDELHVLTSFAGFIPKSVLNNFWDTIKELQKKHPGLKIVCLTATPHFIRMYPGFNFEKEYYIRAKTPLSKPKQIKLVRSTKDLLRTESEYLYLYPSKNMGGKQSNKYSGTYIDSNNKERNPTYQNIIDGLPPENSRIFTSTCLATGLSVVNSNIKIAITNWMSIVDIVQFSARIREGVDILYVGRNIPFFLRQRGLDIPILNFTGDFGEDMKLLNAYETYVSYMLHEFHFDDMLAEILFQMIHLPEQDIEWETLFY